MAISARCVTAALYPALIVVCVAAVLIVIPRRSAGVSDGAPDDLGALYVSPGGSANNDGTRARPLDLRTAFSGKGPARPGHTIWLYGGTYRGTFVSDLTGTESEPIVVRAYPGERVTIDTAPSTESGLEVRGAWTTYWGFEITNSDRLRVGSAGDLRRGGGLDAHGPHITFANLIIHDLAGGMGIWTDAEDTEAYGNLIYYNGFSFKGGDRGHGHGIYTQNRNGVRRLTDNIIFSQFGHGVHAYGSSAAFLDSIHVVGNIVFNNGALTGASYERNILIGGGRVAQDPVVRDNATYYASALPQAENNLGYDAGCERLEASGNYWAHPRGYTLSLRRCEGQITKNTLIGITDPAYMVRYPDNTYTLTPPSGTRIFVRPNRFERGRANIAVYNWDRKPEVTIDVSGSGLEVGESYEVRDAQNYFGRAVVSGRYSGGALRIPMNRLKAALPVGLVPRVPEHTAPDFAAFVLMIRQP